jgi:hypothetical protein
MLGIFTGAGGITEQLKDAYEIKKNAETQTEVIKANSEIKFLEARKAIIIAEQHSALTAWIRPALAFPVVVFWMKIVIWDLVLGLGATDNPSEHVWWYLTLIPSAYFLVRPFEKGKR